MGKVISAVIVLQASGTDQLVSCRVKRIADEYCCQVALPVPRKIEPQSIRKRWRGLEYGGGEVR